jgi:carbon starvation protein
VGFVSHALRFQDALEQGKVLAPASSLAAMRRVVFNDYVDAGLAGLAVIVVLVVVVYAFFSIRRALGTPGVTAVEIGGAAGAAAGGGDD